MSSERQTLGLDRDLRLAWLDATAEWVAEGLPPKELRSRLDTLLEGEVAGTGVHSAKGKTETVLLHVWSTVPERIVPLRDAGLALFPTQDRAGKLALHWGMALATYPFFRDLATAVGRLIAMQKTVTLSQVLRRVNETWGERSTVHRAVHRTLKSLCDWGALEEGSERGVFVAAQKMEVSESRRDVGIWLVEALVSASDADTIPFKHVALSPALFPFNINLSVVDLHKHPRLDVYRQGIDEDIVALRKQPTLGRQSSARLC